MNVNKLMKIIATIITVLGFSFLSTAQKGIVVVEQDQQISDLMQLYKAVNSESNFYTIQVGFGSYNTAEELKSEVDVDFPGLFSKIVFDSPTYRVQIGRFTTKLEAERKFLEVRKKYPAALLLKPEKKKEKKKE